MPKRFIKRYLPDSEFFRRHKHLQRLGNLLHEPNLWHLNRNSIARAFSIGLFCAFLPIPFQMLMAASLAIFFRANIPISVVLVWISNPLTMPAIFYGEYKIGSWILLQPAIAYDSSYNWAELVNTLSDIIPALVLGALLSGLTAAILGNITIRVIWRWGVTKKWRQRKDQSCNNSLPSSSK